MEMKKLIESMDRIEECGMAEMPSMAAPMQQGSPVSVNVSLNASGRDHVADLLDLMKHAGLQSPEPVSAKMLTPRMDMERLRGIVDGPEMDMDMGPEMEEIEGEEGPCPECGMEPCECDHTEEAADGGFGSATSEPDEWIGDIEDVTASGDDLHKEKKSYKVVAGGDNPMAYKATVESIKDTLYAALSEKKNAKPDFLDMDKDGNKKEPMKKAVADKKGSAPKKGKVPPQFAKKK